MIRTNTPALAWREFFRRHLIHPMLALITVVAAGTLARTAAAGPLFTPPFPEYATGLNPFFVAMGDLNGDGKFDLVTSNYSSSSVSVLLGSGGGVFGAKTDYLVGVNPGEVAMGDLNRDGKPDLATSNESSNSVSVLLGNGNGTFGVKRDLATGIAPTAVAIGDLNGDGKPDLVATNTGEDYSVPSTVSVILGNGDGTFAGQRTFGVGIRPSSVAIQDLNGDGFPDLAVANGSLPPTTRGSVSVLLGNGNGTFRAKTDFTAGVDPSSLAVADLNSDGWFDLVVANQSPWSTRGSVSVLLGNGNGTFGASTNFGVENNPLSVVVGDLNGDGIPDLAVANHMSSDVPPGPVSVLLGNGNGTFLPRTDFAVGAFPSAVAIGDLNGDGRLDLAVTLDGSERVSVLLNTGPGLPTPVLLELFRAVPTAAGIRIEWQFSDPNAYREVDLQRAASAVGEWFRVPQVPELQGALHVVVDDAAAEGANTWYRLECVDQAGRAVTFGPISATALGLAQRVALAPVSPNPSTGRSLVTFSLPARGRVRLTLADVQGRVVAVLLDGVREAGTHVASLDARDLKSGVYFVRMESGGSMLTRRLAVVR